jgi:uncharacterized membrane protein YhaH (DUF805 family)
LTEWQRLNPLILVPQCLDFSGTFSRNEYFVAVTLMSVVTVMLSCFTASFVSVVAARIPGPEPSTIILLVYGALAISSLPTAPFIVGATVRRLHDLGRDGKQAILLLLPLVGQILELELLLRGRPRDANTLSLRSRLFDNEDASNSS